MISHVSKLPKLILIALLIYLGLSQVSGQTINQAEFNNKPIKEILIGLGALGGKTILVDETVSGFSSLFISNKTFDQALQIVLEMNNLFKSEKDGIINISKIQIFLDKNSNITISANNVDLETLLKKISKESKKTILYDNFNPQSIDLNLANVSIIEVLQTIKAKLPDFIIESNEFFHYLKKIQTSVGGDVKKASTKHFTVVDGKYSVLSQNVKFSELLENLFSTEKKEYSNLKKGDMIIDRINFANKTFEEMLRLVLELGDADYTINNKIYYIVEVSRTDILKKFEINKTLPLKYISTSLFLNLISGNLFNGNVVKVDKASNSVLLSGSSEELDPIIQFITQIDKQQTNLTLSRFDLSYISPDLVLPLLPEALRNAEPIIVKGTNSLFMFLSAEQKKEVEKTISLIDQPKTSYVVKLKYIKAEDLFSKLPSHVPKEYISSSIDQRYVFFNGTKSQYHDFINLLKYIDIPVPQIKYQVLVIQYQESLSKDFGLKLSRDGKDAEKTFSFLGDQKYLALIGDLGRIFSLGFDIIADFGYLFAINLDAAISTNKAAVLLDTNLNALSNQEVTFKNTNTYRYPSEETDQDTGTTKKNAAITKEIVSGIILTLKGWVSGDGMITMTINSTITKRGSADSGSNIPQTYEKVISTSVRTESGKPIMVGGLMQHDEASSNETLKIHSDSQNTELMIYIIPRVENPNILESSLSESLQYVYEKHGPFSNENKSKLYE